MKGKVFLLVVVMTMVVVACMPSLPTIEVPEDDDNIILPDIKDDEVVNQSIDELLKSFEGKELRFDGSLYIFNNESRISLIKVERDGNSWYLIFNTEIKELIITKEEGVFLSDDTVITIGSDTIELRNGDNYGRYKIT